MKRYDFYWKSNHDWYHFNDDLFPVMNDDAPDEAKESYRNYLRQKGYDVD